jgi:hypothetical protein
MVLRRNFTGWKQPAPHASRAITAGTAESKAIYWRSIGTMGIVDCTKLGPPEREEKRRKTM